MHDIELIKNETITQEEMKDLFDIEQDVDIIKINIPNDSVIIPCMAYSIPFKRQFKP